MLLDLVEAGRAPISLFDTQDPRDDKLIEAFDAINDRLGPGAIQFGPAAQAAAWRSSSAFRSPNYTTVGKTSRRLKPEPRQTRASIRAAVHKQKVTLRARCHRENLARRRENEAGAFRAAGTRARERLSLPRRETSIVPFEDGGDQDGDRGIELTPRSPGAAYSPREGRRSIQPSFHGPTAPAHPVPIRHQERELEPEVGQGRIPERVSPPGSAFTQPRRPTCPNAISATSRCPNSNSRPACEQSPAGSARDCSRTGNGAACRSPAARASPRSQGSAEERHPPHRAAHGLPAQRRAEGGLAARSTPASRCRPACLKHDRTAALRMRSAGTAGFRDPIRPSGAGRGSNAPAYSAAEACPPPRHNRIVTLSPVRIRSCRGGGRLCDCCRAGLHKSLVTTPAMRYRRAHGDSPRGFWRGPGAG